mgnify:CR=1 FL=1
MSGFWVKTNKQIEIMNKVDSKSFIEGRKAYFDGVSTTNNPYGDVGEDSQQWLNGYFSSQFY